MDSPNNNPITKRPVGRPRKSTSPPITTTDSTTKRVKINNNNDNINTGVDSTSGISNLTTAVNTSNNAITTSLSIDLPACSNTNPTVDNEHPISITPAAVVNATLKLLYPNINLYHVNDKVKCMRMNGKVGTVISTMKYGHYEILFKGDSYDYHFSFNSPDLLKITDIEFDACNEPVYRDFDKDTVIDDPELLAGIESFAARKRLNPNEILENIQIKGKLVEIVLKENPEFKSNDTGIVEKNVLEIECMEYLVKYESDHEGQLNKVGLLVLDYLYRIMKESDYWKYLYFNQSLPYVIYRNNKLNLPLLYLSIQKRADFGIKVDDRCDIENNLNELLFHLK